MSIRVREHSVGRRIAGTNLLRTGPILYPKSCRKKWMPRDDVDRTITLSGASITIDNNPLMDAAGLYIGFAQDQLPTNGFPLAGGALFFGPGSTAGIGYYGINSQAVRLNWFVDWQQTMIPYRMADNIVGVPIPVTMDGAAYGNALSPIAHKKFEFSVDSAPPGCVWQSTAPNTINLPEFQVIGEGVDSETTMSIVYDSMMFPAIDMTLNRCKLRIIGGSHYAVFFNDVVGDAPTPILGIPKAVLALYRFGSIYGEETYPTSIQQQATGVALADPTVARNPIASPNIGTVSLSLDRFVRTSLTDPFGFYRRQPQIQRGRSTASAVILETKIQFANGVFDVITTPKIACDSTLRHYLFQTPGTTVTSGADISDTPLYPITPTSSVNLQTGDLAEWSNTDPTEGVYVRIRNLTAIGSPDPAGLVDDGDVIIIDPMSLKNTDIFDLISSGPLPAFLGDITVTVPLSPYTGGPGAATPGFVSLEDRWDHFYSSPGDYGLIDPVVNTFGQEYTCEVVSFSKTMTDEVGQFRRPEDPVHVELVPADPTANDTEDDTLNWIETSGVAVATAPTPHTQVQILVTPISDSATLIRDIL